MNTARRSSVSMPPLYGRWVSRRAGYRTRGGVSCPQVLLVGAEAFGAFQHVPGLGDLGDVDHPVPDPVHPGLGGFLDDFARSEERRVGEESSARWVLTL